MVSRRTSRKTKPDAYFLDTNVLIYAAGGPHSLREPCRVALEAAVARRVSLVTDSEVLQEILYRYFSLQQPDIAREVYQAATGLCDEVLPVSERTTARARELLIRYTKLSARDAIHIASMEEAGVQRLLSTDRDFDEVAEVRRVDPADFLA
ncbi:MAG TPA: type II toxin-antitoxin system VapC family toxin [Vicinamibacteria bacterium]